MNSKTIIKIILFIVFTIVVLSLVVPQWFAIVKLTDTDNDGNPEYSVKNYSLRILTPGEWTVYTLDDYYGWIKCGEMYGPEVSSPLAISVRPFNSTTLREVEFKRFDGAPKYKLEVEVSFHKPGPIILEKKFDVQ